MIKIFVREGIPADLDLGTVRPGTYELVHCTGRGEARNSKPEPAYLLDNLTVSVKRVEQHIANGNAEIINEVKTEVKSMTNLPATVKQDYDVFAIMDKLDDEIILAELENRVVSTWVYSFPGQDGKTQTGLSKRGVDEACTEMAKKGHVIEEDSIEYSPCPISGEHVLFKAQVRRVLINKDGSRVPMETVFGTKRQWIKEQRKDKSIFDDKFWFEKGAAKALRNARSRLIPAEIQATIISLAKSSGKVKNIVTNGVATPPNTPKAERKPEPESKDTPESAEVTDFIPSGVNMKEGETKGKAWVRYTILDGETKYTTFNKSFAQLAKDANINVKQVKVWYKTGKYGRDIELLIDPLADDNNPGDEDDRYPR
jgi:hypothetical protein